ncbi:cytochrome C [Paracoccus sp. PXZ]|uniref:c-type cytochrome n=1 Tax=Paracoccus sp. MKU1 TaxID=1745182 RepID=UPI00071930D0|nr:hypothetical protein [Paracoccus sp. MKU1]KRW96797.1 cytochrome C [Paracoccus sp. MKU1]
MKISIYATLAAATLALPAVAQDGDAAKGEKEFNKCKACHMVQAPDGTDIVKGGKTGPNLYGIVGRKIASEEGFKYGDGILEVAEKNPDMVWTEAELIEYVTDPKPWLVKQTGDSGAKTKMTFKMGKNQADVVAFLTQHSPDAGGTAEPAAEGETN